MINPFSSELRQITAGDLDQIAKMRLLASDLFRAIDALPDSREKALAMTNLQQAVMWAVAAVAG